jgi:DMATS type aromatic prenyltransferase
LIKSVDRYVNLFNSIQSNFINFRFKDLKDTQQNLRIYNSEATMTKFEAIATELKSINSADLLSTHPQIDRSAQAGFNPEELVPKLTYVEAGIEKLTALCDAVGLKDKTAQAIEIFRAMTVSWGDRSIRDESAWKSDVSDDFSPFEFSIAFKEDRAELRVLLEAQGTEPTLQSNWQAGLNLNQYLAEHFNVSLDRFRQIEDLFVPTNPDAKLAMWHAVVFYPDKEPSFKLYLNPQAQAKSRAAAVVEESFVRLGFPHAWSTLAEVAAQRGPDKDEFVYFSLDLNSHSQARVKVYLRHYDATAEDLENALSAARNYVAGSATEFCQAMAEGQTVFSAKPAITCFSLVEGDNSIPSNGTVYLPISNYAADDRAVCDCIDRYFTQQSLPLSIYHAAIQSSAARPLEEGIGIQSYISMSLDQRQRRVSIYLNPEVNAISPPRKTADMRQRVSSLPSLEEMACHYEEHSLTHHPFFQRLQREQVNPQHLWLLVMNIRETATNFTRRLANIVAGIDDERIRCLLAKQLNDELGNGDVERIHRKLFDRLMTAIEPWRIESRPENMLMPGQEISDLFEEIYLHSNPYVGVGSIIVAEIYAKQFDICLGNELRKTNVDRAEIKWVTIHEELEIEHANESILLARFVADSEEGVIAARQGIEKTRLASWRFLDGLYRLCYDTLPAIVSSVV